MTVDDQAHAAEGAAALVALSISLSAPSGHVVARWSVRGMGEPAGAPSETAGRGKLGGAGKACCCYGVCGGEKIVKFVSLQFDFASFL